MDKIYYIYKLIIKIYFFIVDNINLKNISLRTSFKNRLCNILKNKKKFNFFSNFNILN